MGKGGGLGLAIVHAVIAKHGGTIRLESRVGEGTTFVIRLPVQGQMNGPFPVVAEPAAGGLTAG